MNEARTHTYKQHTYDTTENSNNIQRNMWLNAEKSQRSKHNCIIALIKSILQLSEVVRGGAGFISQVIPPSNEELDVFLPPGAIRKTAAVHIEQVALRRVGKFSILSSI